MISIKEYLEQTQAEPDEQTPTTSGDGAAQVQQEILPIALSAYRSALVEMGNCGQNACPALGDELKLGLEKLGARLCAEVTSERVVQSESEVRDHLQKWGHRAASHYRQKTNEVKDILLVMARTAESVGERDQRCAQQINAVTVRLKGIANLEDLTEIRESIKKSAAELKVSIDRMSAEGKAAIDQLKAEVTHYQTRLEEAETMASRDPLTGVRSRPWVEGQIEQALQGQAPFSVAILDLDKFKQVNDEYGHLVGDELLKQFAAKMRSVCRVTDTTGRWGGDEFILLLHCRLQEARAQIDRMREWVCVNYTLQGNAAPVKLRVHASIGVAERQPGETMKELIDRADAEMYREKAVARAKNIGAER
jgi:diguanylate cyclase